MISFLLVYSDIKKDKCLKSATISITIYATAKKINSFLFIFVLY